MNKKRVLYGLMGLLSLIGFIGVFTDDKIYLAFFVFVVHFQFLFIKSDEMFEAYMNRSAAIAFYFGMITVAIVTTAAYFLKTSTGAEALLYGFASGWVVSILAYAGLIAYHSIMEGGGLEHDNE